MKAYFVDGANLTDLQDTRPPIPHNDSLEPVTRVSDEVLAENIRQRMERVASAVLEADGVQATHEPDVINGQSPVVQRPEAAGTAPRNRDDATGPRGRSRRFRFPGIRRPTGQG